MYFLIFHPCSMCRLGICLKESGSIKSCPSPSIGGDFQFLASPPCAFLSDWILSNKFYLFQGSDRVSDPHFAKKCKQNLIINPQLCIYLKQICLIFNLIMLFSSHLFNPIDSGNATQTRLKGNENNSINLFTRHSENFEFNFPFELVIQFHFLTTF